MIIFKPIYNIKREHFGYNNNLTYFSYTFIILCDYIILIYIIIYIIILLCIIIIYISINIY